MKTGRTLLVFVLGIIAGGALLASGIFGFHLWVENKCHYKYVNADFVCGEDQIISKTGYVAFENDLKAYIEGQKSAGAIQDGALYFRDLRAGPTMGVNSREDFSPASLLKLPLIITLFNLQETMPEILQDNIMFRQEDIADFDIPPQNEMSDIELQEGKIYSVEELMRNTIVYSDNNSYYTLVAFLNRVVGGGGDKILQTFQDLGVIDPRTPAEETVNVQGYATIFRILYNASYLSPESSDKLLAWLADSTYIKGLKAGIPDNVVVAHKFGERQFPDGAKQLHDCGIVFYDKNPYLLCVMTKGQDWDALRATIKEISRRVYSEVDSRRIE